MNPTESSRSNGLSWARDLLPSCRDVTRLQSRALDETLPLRVRIGLKCHLSFCVWCRRYGRQLRFIRDVLQRGEERLAEGHIYELPPATRAQIKEFLRKEA